GEYDRPHEEPHADECLAKEGLTNDEIKTVTLTVVPPVNTEQALRRAPEPPGFTPGLKWAGRNVRR
ncbi:hypothetical protein AB0K36_32425, partial [Streptomyces kurssanovii]